MRAAGWAVAAALAGAIVYMHWKAFCGAQDAVLTVTAPGRG